VTPHFFAVSVVKLLVMNLATGGFYQLYWFYQHWQVIRARTGEPLSPPLRALFNIFFAYPLFRRIGAEAPPGQVSPLLLALVYITIGIALLAPLPEPWSLVGLLAILPLLEVQSQANIVNRTRTPTADANGKFTWTNVAGIAAGAAAWTVLIGGLVQAQRDPGSLLNLQARAVAAREGLPRTVDEGVKLIEVKEGPRKLDYTYLVADAAVVRFRTDAERDALRRAHTRAACDRQDLRRMIDANVTLTHVWRSRADETLLTLTITKASCGPTGPAGGQRAAVSPR
jgi:hypothetical protein